MSPALAALAGSYRPRSYTNDLKEIVADHLDEPVRVWDERFASDFGPLHPRVKDLFEGFRRIPGHSMVAYFDVSTTSRSTAGGRIPPENPAGTVSAVRGKATVVCS